jgi:prepilin signal peptidase PulO-like enzyme (type II secretory pathway)
MVTKQLDARPETFYEYEEEVTNRKQTCRYCIDRAINALTVLLFGLGVLAFFVGLCTDVFTVGQGVIGWVALWVVAYTIRVYYGRWERFDASDTEDQS